MKARLLGIGSPFGADRLGWLAAERLAPHLPDGVETQTLDRPGPALLEHLAGTDAACLIDAARGEAAPGHLYRLGLDELPRAPGLTSTHGLGLADTLRLGAALGALPPRLLVLAVEVGRHQTFEPPLTRAWPRLLAAARAFFEGHGTVTGRP